MKKIVIAAIASVLAIGTAVSGASIAFAQPDLVKQREENRKATAAEMRAIKGIIDSKGDTHAAQAHAAKLKELELAFVKMFPPGSDAGDTKALPTVWTDAAGFQAASKAADAAYDQLAMAAGSGDIAQLNTAFQAVGKTCGACHQKFRAKQN